MGTLQVPSETELRAKGPECCCQIPRFRPFFFGRFQEGSAFLLFLLLPSPFGPPAGVGVRWVTASEMLPLGGQGKTRCRRIFHGRPVSQEAKPAAVGRSRAAAKRRHGPGGACRAVAERAAQWRSVVLIWSA